jgi:HPr kinase/phosphorylase
VPVVFVTKGQELPSGLLDAANRAGVAILRSPLKTNEFYRRLKPWLEDEFAPQTTLHGSLADVFGVGLLFIGKSGIGKSECVLDLVERGHRLVADDVVHLTRRPDGTVYGRGNELIRHHMEIRGLGIINIKDLFGVASVRERKKIELVIELVEWDPSHEYDRLGVEQDVLTIVGVDVPHAVVPVRPGRNMTTIVEVAARNHLLKLQGHHSAQEFAERLKDAIAKGRPDRPDVSVEMSEEEVE